MKRMLSMLFVLAFACNREAHPPQTATAGYAKTPAKPPAAIKIEEPPPVPSTEVGETMPAFTAKRLDGAPFDIAAERNKVVLLNVWATWCGPCRFETPELQKIHDKYAARGFEVVGVSIDETGADVVKPFVQEQKVTYPIVLDPDAKIANLLQTTVLPTSVVVDRGGKIVWRRIGALVGPDATLDAAIEKAVSQPSS